MKQARVFFLVIVLLAFNACAEDHFLRIPLGGLVQGLKPNYDQAKRFVANTGDTLQLRRIGESTFWEEQRDNLPVTESLGDYDYLLLERQNLTIGCDTPYLRFSFNLEANYAPGSPRLGTDAYRLSFTEESNPPIDFNLSFIDSLQCQSARCSFTDTLKLNQRTFFNCYFTPRDSVSLQALYINVNKGLVGFKSTDNRIFELID